MGRKLYYLSVLAGVFILGAFFALSAALSYQPFVDQTTVVKKLLPIVRWARKTTDIVYLPYYFQSTDLPKYYLEIDPQDLEKLNANLPPAFSGEILTKQYKKTVPAKLIYQNKEYSVNVRYRGDMSEHWSYPKKSWLIRFKRSDLLGNKRRIHLIIPQDRGFLLEHFDNYRAKKLDLLTPESQFVVLYVNGKANGVYFEIEGWDEEFLEKNQRSPDANFYGTEDYEIRHWVSASDENEIGFFVDLAAWKKYTQDKVSNYDNFAELDLLIKFLTESSDEEFYQKIPLLIDMDSFYRWEIHSALATSNHQNLGNLRLYFNNQKGKFEFVPWDVSQAEPVALDKTYNLLTKRILSNPDFFEKRNRILWQYVKDDRNLEDDLRFYDLVYQQTRVAFYKDRLKLESNYRFDRKIEEIRQDIIKSYRFLQEELKAYFNEKNLSQI